MSGKLLTTEKFIEKAKKVHGDKYSYDNVVYRGCRIGIDITCKIHGSFIQCPNNHLSNKGCPKCSNTYVPTTEEFIENAKSIHGDKYDYSKTIYKNTTTKVDIICPEHGKFSQLPENHIKLKQGCPKCKGGISIDNLEFIKRAINRHGNKYDYSRVNYINSKTKVDIICSKHGLFKQAPSEHLYGKGCPICKSSHLETELRLYLIKNNIQFEEQKSWDWLIYESKQYVDFYLPKYNVAIECQGLQHFKDTGGYYSENFLKQKERDKNKKELCFNKGIQVYYYSKLKTKDKIYKLDYLGSVYEDIDTLINDIKQSTNLPD